MGTPVDPIGWAIIAATVVSAGANAYGSMQAGKAQEAQYRAEARALEMEAKQADLQAKQISALRLQELNANLGAIVAMRAGKNLMGDSPTGANIIRSFTRESLGARSNEVLEARLQALSKRNAMSAAKMAGTAARQAGTINAIGAVADGVSSVAGFMRPRPPLNTSGAKKPAPITRTTNRKVY